MTLGLCNHIQQRTHTAKFLLPPVLLAVVERYARALASRGGGIANLAMRSRIAANNRRGTATSANWNVTYFECRVTFAPIFTSFSRSVVSDQCLTARGKASRRSKFARLYAKANKRNNG